MNLYSVKIWECLRNEATVLEGANFFTFSEIRSNKKNFARCINKIY